MSGKKPNVKVLREHRLYDRVAQETRVVKVGDVLSKASYDDARESSFNWLTLVNTKPAKLIETDEKVGPAPEPAKAPAAPTAGKN